MDSLWRSFTILNLTHNHRQGEDRSYAEILNRIRVGEQTEDDKIILDRRVRHEDHPDLHTASIRIFSTVAEVIDYNNEKMAELPGKCHIMEADHFTSTNSSFKPNIDKAGRVGDTQMMDCLHLKLKSRVMLINNICVMDGMVNGAVGELIGVEERRNGEVDKLVIKFDNPQTGAETRKACPILASKYPGGTPIFRKELEYSLARSNSLVSSTAKVLQFPVIPAFAVTCHRFQGQTIPWPSKVIVDLRKVFQAAQAYVMLSRVQSIQQLYILGELQARKIYADKKALAEVRRLEEVSLNNNPTPWTNDDPSTTKVIFLNARSIKNKFDMLKTDYNLLKADLILISETWLDDKEDETVSLDGYNSSFQGGGRGGGTCAFYKEEFVITEEIIEDREYYITKLSSKDIEIINIYKAPGGSIINVSHHLENLLSKKTLIVGGDLNVCYLKDRNNPLTNFLESVGFIQMVDRPSHLEGGLLDHLYFRQTEEYTAYIETFAKYYSDHDATCATIQKVILCT